LIKSEDEKDDPCDDVTSSDISKWIAPLQPPSDEDDDTSKG